MKFQVHVHEIKYMYLISRLNFSKLWGYDSTAKDEFVLSLFFFFTYFYLPCRLYLFFHPGVLSLLSLAVFLASVSDQMPPKRDEAALQEEEELQLAIALSQSEAEEKERMVG